MRQVEQIAYELVRCGALESKVLSFFFQAEDGIRDVAVTGVQTCALPISRVSAGGLGDSLGRRTVVLPALGLLALSIALLATVRSASALATAGLLFGTAQGFEIGRAACRGRGEISVGAGSFKKKSVNRGRD